MRKENHLNKPLEPNYKVDFEFADGTGRSLYTSVLAFKGIRQKGNGGDRPVYITVTCNNAPLDYIANLELKRQIMDLSQTLKLDCTHEGRVILKPYWFHQMLANI